MATTFNKIYKKVANNGDSNDYQLISNVGSGGVPITVMQGATESSDGVGGLMPSVSNDHNYTLLRGDGTYRDLNIYTNNDYNTGLVISSGSPNDIKTVIPVLDEYTIRDDNMLVNYTRKCMIGYEAYNDLLDLPNGYEVTYDRSKLVYHVWGLNESNYKDQAEYNNMLSEEDSNTDTTSKMIKLNFVNNSYTQDNPFFYPFAELSDGGYKRTDIRTVKYYGEDKYPLEAYVKQKYNGMNICGIRFNIPGLYAIFVRYWYRSHNNHRRVSLNPWFNGIQHPCYRNGFSTMITARELTSELFFHYFKEGETFDLGVHPIDPCSSSNFVQFSIADLVIYAIKWNGQFNIIEK